MNNNKTTIDSEDQPGYIWFKFFPVDWLTDPDVISMTAAERGTYIDLLAVQWRDNGLPEHCDLIAKLLPDDSRTVTRWFQKWGRLFPCDLRLSKRANPKLLQLAVNAGKIVFRENTDENKNREDGEEMISIPPDGGIKQTSSEKRVSWPGEPNPNCPICHGRGNTIDDDRTVGCICTAEELDTCL